MRRGNTARPSKIDTDNTLRKVGRHQAEYHMYMLPVNARQQLRCCALGVRSVSCQHQKLSAASDGPRAVIQLFYYLVERASNEIVMIIGWVRRKSRLQQFGTAIEMQRWPQVRRYSCLTNRGYNHLNSIVVGSIPYPGPEPSDLPVAASSNRIATSDDQIKV